MYPNGNICCILHLFFFQFSFPEIKYVGLSFSYLISNSWPYGCLTLLFFFFVVTCQIRSKQALLHLYWKTLQPALHNRLVYLMKTGVSLSARLVVIPYLLSESLSQVVSSVLQLVLEDREALPNLGHPAFTHTHTRCDLRV